MCRTMIAIIALITLASCRTVSGPEPAARRVSEQSVALGGRLSSSDDALPELTNLRAIRSVDRRWGHVLRISANVAPHAGMPAAVS